MSEMAKRIRTFITEEIAYDQDPAAVRDDTVLLGSFMDSLGLMQLVAFIEEEFDVNIDDADVTANNFRTVNDIARLVSEKAGVP